MHTDLRKSVLICGPLFFFWMLFESALMCLPGERSRSRQRDISWSIPISLLNILTR